MPREKDLVAPAMGRPLVLASIAKAARRSADVTCRSGKPPGPADKAGLASISALPAAKDLFDGMRAFIPIAKALS